MVKSNQIIIIEGARNVGKTFLVNSVSDILPIYKFPFTKYYNNSFTEKILIEDKQKSNNKKELFYLTIGFDITIFDLAKKGLLKSDLIIDRGILSDIIFGIQSGRVCIDEAVSAWAWLITEYQDIFTILYIRDFKKTDDRNKDSWDHYDKNKTISLTNVFLDKVKYTTNIIDNNFDEESVQNFRHMIQLLID